MNYWHVYFYFKAVSITAHNCIFIIPKLVPLRHINYVSESETDNNLDPMNFKDVQSGQ